MDFEVIFISDDSASEDGANKTGQSCRMARNEDGVLAGNGSTNDVKLQPLLHQSRMFFFHC